MSIKRRMQFEEQYQMMQNFVTQLLDEFPVVEGSAWRHYLELLQERNLGIMQGLSELE